MHSVIHKSFRKSQRSAFALLLTLIVVTALSTSTVALSLLSSTEFARTSSRAANLDHQLALQSAIRLLPDLLEQSESQTRNTSDRRKPRFIELTLGDCNITILAREESTKLRIGSGSRSQDLERTIRQIAHANSLTLDNIDLVPIVRRDDETTSLQYVWYEQIVQAVSFEDIFPWHERWATNNVEEPLKGMSDLITFWGGGSSARWGLHVVTNIHGDRRQWFVVAGVKRSESESIFSIRVPW